ncbi:ABC transporter permease [Hyphomicrobium sp.]|jgi:osmoprotectant transport system permease protein|uniref:ABC transporter permease n=1 Tax=Hyphomicrobium sp. TaxID=82 RepID=UPI002BCDC15E|nr:ABC transporter permease [Hyphomicrobium sp.]HVZ03664.1 ABC transporter permease [Hyphomicrobium sp.]
MAEDIVAAAGLRNIWRNALYLMIFMLGAWAWGSGLLPSLFDHWDDIRYLGRQHIELVAISGGLAIVVGVLTGILLTRPRFYRYGEWAIQILNIGATIPTLAVLALSMSVLGIGDTPAIFALFIASLLPIVANTIAGIRAVPPHLLEAARGMGLSSNQILWQVELPNAAFVIYAGIRTALAINVGTAPLAFLIGGGGLGELIFAGISLNEFDTMLAGAIPTALLAVLVDFLMGQVQFWTVPRGVNPLR